MFDCFNFDKVVMNNFVTEAVEMKLMTTVFQNMFPSIKVQKVFSFYFYIFFYGRSFLFAYLPFLINFVRLN